MTGDPAPPANARPALTARRLALDALTRIDRDGAYANLLVPHLLEHSGLSTRDRGFVTELVYGTTRMRRACDWLVDQFLLRDVDQPVRAALRMGTYQLAFLDTPPHAAVSATVEAVPKRTRGFVNAVLRRVATAPLDWPDDAVRLSYPDWIVDRLAADLGREAALDALQAMNEPAEATERADGYVQDRASQEVAALVGAGPGERVADLCAAPGGKATALAATGAFVVAADRREGRLGLVTANARRLGLPGERLQPLVADATRPPFPPASFDRVLVDAPCSGLGALRRRPDARWRIDAGDVDRLAVSQRAMVDAAVPLLRPGGTLVYSVCTMTRTESIDVAEHVASGHPGLVPGPAPGLPWKTLGPGALLLPQAAGTDGMAVFRWTAPS